jgi:hypothetical protein
MATPSPSLQHGGMINPFYALFDHMASPPKLIYGFLMVLIIVYSSTITTEFRTFADSMLGRLIGVGLVYGVTESMGWIYGLLTALAFLLLLHGAPRIEQSFKEGFDGGGSVTEKKAVGKRWFVEKVLGERTSAIATDRVMTHAITD